MLSGSEVDQIRSLKGKMDCWWVEPWTGDNTMIEMRGLLLVTLFNWDYRGGGERLDTGQEMSIPVIHQTH